MKRMLTCLLFICIAGTAASQTLSDEVAYIRSVFGKERKDLIKQFLNLNEADAAKFWPLYDEYAAKYKSLGDDRFSTISDYAKQYSTLTNDQAKSLANRIFKNDKELLKLQEKYFKKISKAVSPLKAAQFMQADQYIQTTIKSAMQDAIPFIGEFEQNNKH